MRLSVVIPTIGRPHLRRTLDRLDRQEGLDADFEAIVVQDPGADVPVAAEIVEGRGFEAQLLRAELRGASAARNTGWRAARAPLVLFVDDDILPGPNCLAAHLAAHRARPQSWAGVLGRVRWAPELRVTPFMRWLERGIQFDFDTIQGEEAGWWRLFTANCSIKRTMLEAVRGFDEEWLPYLYEDLDLGKRMCEEHGFRLFYEPRAVGDHLHATTLEEWHGHVALVASSEWRFVQKHPELEPWFLKLFRAAADEPRARGLLARLAPLVPPGAPWIGPRVWASVDRRYRQALAPSFLEAWERAARGEDAAQPSGAPK
jgi:glycosyltransferase involved in cell wall biosynthesis